MYDIIKLLNIEDENLKVADVEIQNQTKTITLDVALYEHYCPLCGARMYSKGIKPRIVQHPMMQDGYKLVLVLRRRYWQCTNLTYRFEQADIFKFVSKNRRISNATDLLVVNAFRNINDTAAKIGERFQMSDHQAIDIFSRYVNMKRLPLTEYVSVDEVYLDLDVHCKYALVIQDFVSGEPIDLVISRQKKYTEPYFMNIPREERLRVKYLISDMYNPYLSYADNYFPNALQVVDSFHVMQWINNKLDVFLRRLLKEFKIRDQERIDKISLEKGYHVTLKDSDEVYLLKHHKWILLRNQEDIDYKQAAVRNFHFGYVMDTYALEERFLAIHPDLEPLRCLKEEYVHFNKSNAGNPENAAKELNELIEMYATSGYSIFNDFANVLQTYRQPIINSFIMTVKTGKSGEYHARLSNGPIESLNRKVKDLKRNGRGYLNFNHLRNRFLFAARNNPVLSGR